MFVYTIIGFHSALGSVYIFVDHVFFFYCALWANFMLFYANIILTLQWNSSSHYASFNTNPHSHVK